MKAIILSIGDELVLGQTVDTNSAYLSAQLVSLGIPTIYHQTVADDQAAIAQAIDQACRSAEWVLVTGGLGPTEDDLTRHGLAQAMNVPLVLDQERLRDIEAYFIRRQLPMSRLNQVQAMHPAGTTMIPNSCGTAPGIQARFHQANLFITPGVPREMVAMFEQSIRPILLGRPGNASVILTCKINTFGLGESLVAQRLGSLMDRTRNPKVGTTVSMGLVSVRIRSEFPEVRQAQDQLAQTIQLVEEKLTPYVVGRDEQSLDQTLVQLLKQQNKTLATAESCTGGLIGKMLTDVPGSSAVYRGGWITYANERKTADLGVDPTLLAQYGAVSQLVVKAMAMGALQKSGADLAVATTGVAGPDGGTPDKPVGCVWVALAWKNPDSTTSCDALLLTLAGDRETIRDRAAKAALQIVRFHLLSQPLDLLTWGKRLPA